MYSFNPAMAEMLTNERVAELKGQGMACARHPHQLHRLRSLRHRTGWALVEIGLRLALPRRSAVPVPR